jgi:rhodanese-related sulfurtransferase
MTDAVPHFAARLAHETDVSDVHAALASGADFVLVDSRGVQSWLQGRIPGAMHLPTAEIARRALAEIPVQTPIVTYCWGPGCNGATRAAHEFALLGYQVREMLGGFEYWAREGFDVETDAGVRPGTIDPLTAPRGVACAC